MPSVETAVFRNRRTAEAAIRELEASGFGQEDISLLMSDGTHGKEWRVGTGSKAAEGAALGAATGGAIGALATGLTAITVATGGMGIFAAGPLLTALAGAGVGGGAGGVVGGLIGLGMPEHEATLAESEIRGEGGILVGVAVSEATAGKVRSLLREHGGASLAETETH